jgi:hypothetical protein
VIFEMMVLFGGLGLFVAWLVRCRLYPGKKPHALLQGETDNRFVLVLGEPASEADAAEVGNLLQAHRAVSVEAREE